MSEASNSAFAIREGRSCDIDALARLWRRGWQDAHAELLPEALADERSLERLRERMAEGIAEVRVAVCNGEAVGFHWLKDAELNQFYVATEARGAGVATRLIADAERLLFENGVRRAWLACAIGNRRAAHFYTKSGWAHTRTQSTRHQVESGWIEIDIWRFEKQLEQFPPTAAT